MVENAVLGGRNVSIHCADGVIADIRDDGAELAGVQRGAVDRLDGRGCLVAPGLINAHTHAAMTLFRGRADDLPSKFSRGLRQKTSIALGLIWGYPVLGELF